jgi:DnaJ family protein A protein 2
VLSDPKKKEIYDRYGLKGLQEGGSDGFSSPEDIFSHMFGGSLFGGFGGLGGIHDSALSLIAFICVTFYLIFV